MSDIFALREQAQAQGLRNRAGSTPVDWLVPTDAVVPIEHIDGTIDEPAIMTLQCSECGNILTITDRGRVCRQCRLDWPLAGGTV